MVAKHKKTSYHASLVRVRLRYMVYTHGHHLVTEGLDHTETTGRRGIAKESQEAECQLHAVLDPNRQASLRKDQRSLRFLLTVLKGLLGLSLLPSTCQPQAHSVKSKQCTSDEKKVEIG